MLEKINCFLDMSPYYELSHQQRAENCYRENHSITDVSQGSRLGPLLLFVIFVFPYWSRQNIMKF